MINLSGIQSIQKTEEKENVVNHEEAQQLIADLKTQIAALAAPKKNHRPSKVTDKKYARLGILKLYGNVPQQQKDLAAILISRMEIGVEYSEKEVYDFLIDGMGDYSSLTKSSQDVTYLFRYYRSLKPDVKYAGFVARDFLRVV